MFCYNCGCHLSEHDYCTSCGVDVSLYKRIMILSNLYYNEGLARANPVSYTHLRAHET